MIAATILALHFIAAVYAFLKYRKEGTGEGLIAVAFVVVIFSVGWTISTMISKLVFPAELAARLIAQLQETRTSRLVAKELTIDTFSLVLLTAGEIVFYYFFLKPGLEKGGKKGAVGS